MILTRHVAACEPWMGGSRRLEEEREGKRYSVWTGRISMETVQQQNRGGLLLTILRIDYVIIDFRKLIMIIEFFNFRPNIENLGFEDSVPTLWMVDGSFCRSSFYEYAHIYNVIILFFINISFK